MGLEKKGWRERTGERGLERGLKIGGWREEVGEKGLQRGGEQARKRVIRRLQLYQCLYERKNGVPTQFPVAQSIYL
jgi:hypothetical protein